MQGRKLHEKKMTDHIAAEEIATIISYDDYNYYRPNCTVV